ncbi:hypothetical protein TKK_0012985 [Trichogramma kaykai]|uniref:Transposable element P transposase n=1 Tax=Trichogramma kaykai TaxID=54128 RepID=A0ABD2WKB4_9HYME
MLSGLQYNWKQAIFYGFLKGPVSAPNLNLIVQDLLDKVEYTGFKIRTMVCDQGSTNQRLIADLGISTDKPYIERFERKIFFNYDAPHLIKCWRNNLMENDFIVENDQVSWECLKELRDLEKYNPCRAVPKLTDRHLEPNNFQKMNVKLAVQVFNDSVSRAMFTGYNCGQLKHSHCQATVSFLWSMNKLFDWVNARHPKDPNPFRRGLSKKNEEVENTLRQFIPWLDQIRVVGKPNNPPCFENLKLTINASLLLWEEKKKNGQPYLLTGKLNQDPLENYFAFMRHLSGCNTHPTSMKFRQNHQHGTVMSLMFPLPGANCQPDECRSLLASLTQSNKIQADKPDDTIVFEKLKNWLVNDYVDEEFSEIKEAEKCPETDISQPTLVRWQ